MVYVTISALVLVIGVLCWVIHDLGVTARHQADLTHRDRVDTRVRLLEIIQNSQAEYRALVESYVRQEGKVFVTPVTRYENSLNRPPSTPDPPKHAFKFKPPTPVMEGKPSINSRPDESMNIRGKS